MKDTDGNDSHVPYGDGDFAELWVEAGGEGLEEAMAQFIPPKNAIEQKGKLLHDDVMELTEIYAVLQMFEELTPVRGKMLRALDLYQKFRTSEEGYAFEIYADMISQRFRRDREKKKSSLMDKLLGRDNELSGSEE